MSFLDRFKYDISKPEEDLSNQIKNSIKYYGIFTFIIVLFAGTKLVFDINGDSSINIIASISVIVALLLNFVIVRQYKLVKYGPAIFTVIVAAFSLHTLVTREIYEIGVLITAVLPIIFISFFGTRRGLISGIGFIFLVTVLFAIPENDMFYFDYTIKFKLLFCLSYVMILTFVYILELIKAAEYQKVEKMMLQEMNENKQKTDFINKLSHSLRTPLNNILVITNIVTNTDLDEKQKDLVDTIYASTNNLVDVVNSMVSISSSSGYETELKFNFNLKKTIQNTIKLYSGQHANLKFETKFSDNIPDVFIGDPVKIKQIFLNVIENMLKNKIRDKVDVKLSVSKVKEEGDNFIINVVMTCDSPLHIPTTTVNQYITSEKPNEEKSPLYIELFDLAISKRLIELNGGNLSVELSKQDAVFSFPYKLTKSVNIFETQASNDEVKTKEVEPQSFDKKQIDLVDSNVLLVEDNLINQKIVVLSLKNHVKNIDIANNGKEALDKFGSSKYDIILMDIQMPIMNGITSTKKIREIEKSIGTHTPIIAITANALLGDKEECINAGMDEYISKPFQIEVLIQKMKVLLGGS